MTRLPAAGGRARSPWLWLDDVDRPGALTGVESQSDVDHPQQILTKAAARHMCRRHRVRQQESGGAAWPCLHGLEDALQEEGGLLEGHILIEKVGQRIHENDETGRLRVEEWFQAFAEQRSELPTREGSHQMDAAQEPL